MPLSLLRQKMADKNLDGFIVTGDHNRRYLSGFTGSAGTLIISADAQVLATDSRYYEQAGQQCPDWELVRVGYDLKSRLPEMLRELGLGAGRIGFESAHLSVARFQEWERALEGFVSLVPTAGLVEELRAVKRADELAAIRRAVSLADEALAHVADRIEPGMTEVEVAWDIESYMRTHGAEAMSFPPTVAAGARGALPHARATGQRITAGEPIVLDLGCVVDGYCSDVTRTFCLGSPANKQYLAVWDLVNRANEAALAGLQGGVPGAEVDKLAREIIAGAGYGENFGHSLGHGVGLAVHEEPRVSYTNEAPLPSGAVVTIEPGIYLPGQFGVRIEDLVLVTDDGVEVLTGAPKFAILPR